MKIGDRFECEIESVAFGGDGVARVGGMVAFVAFALPGEKLVGRVTAIKRDYFRAEIVELTHPSPHRIKPACPYFRRCPGCAYMHTDQEGEREIKFAQLEHILKSLGFGIRAEMAEPLPQLGYRNKIVLHASCERGETVLGYVGRKQSETVDVERCLLAASGINDELAACRAKPGFFHSLHHGMDVTFRAASGGVVWWRNSPPRGLSWLRTEMPFGVFSVPAASFSQVNPYGAAKLLELFGEELVREPAPLVADIYAGCGMFALQAALSGTPETVMLESDAESAAAAAYNFKQHGREAKILTGDAAEVLPELVESLPDGALVVVDPPRNGLVPAAVRALGSERVRRLIYVSCDPATFARDAAKLAACGLAPRRIAQVDMFPRSAGFELFTVWGRD